MSRPHRLISIPVHIAQAVGLRLIPGTVASHCSVCGTLCFVAPANALPVLLGWQVVWCFPCVQADPRGPGQISPLTDADRADLHEYGMTDADIERAEGNIARRLHSGSN